MTGEIVSKTKIMREPGYLYYISFDEKGYLIIGKAKLKRGGKSKVGKINKKPKLDVIRNIFGGKKNE